MLAIMLTIDMAILRRYFMPWSIKIVFLLIGFVTLPDKGGVTQYGTEQFPLDGVEDTGLLVWRLLELGLEEDDFNVFA